MLAPSPWQPARPTDQFTFVAAGPRCGFAAAVGQLKISAGKGVAKGLCRALELYFRARVVWNLKIKFKKVLIFMPNYELSSRNLA